MFPCESFQNYIIDLISDIASVIVFLISMENIVALEATEVAYSKHFVINQLNSLNASVALI